MENEDLIRTLQARIRDYEDEISRLRSEKFLLANENINLKKQLEEEKYKSKELYLSNAVTQASLDMAIGNPLASQFMGSTPQDILEEAANQEMQSENAKKFL